MSFDAGWDEESYCDHCGAKRWHSEMERIGGNWFCGECSDDVVVCEDCGEGVHVSSATRCTSNYGEYWLCAECMGQIAVADTVNC